MDSTKSYVNPNPDSEDPNDNLIDSKLSSTMGRSDYRIDNFGNPLRKEIACLKKKILLAQTEIGVIRERQLLENEAFDRVIFRLQREFKNLKLKNDSSENKFNESKAKSSEL